MKVTARLIPSVALALILCIPPHADRTTRVSVSSAGAGGNGHSGGGSGSSYELTDDGWQVAYSSNAANLIIGDTNDMQDAFVALDAVNGGAGVQFGDGLRCAGTGVVRLGITVATVSGTASFGPGLIVMGDWAPGDRRRFQVWYRDPQGPCGSGFNLTNGLRVDFGS